MDLHTSSSLPPDSVPATKVWLARQSHRARLLWQWAKTGQLRAQLGHRWRIRRAAQMETSRPHLPELIESVDPATIRIARAERPTVSVIVPTYGKVDYTLC